MRQTNVSFGLKRLGLHVLVRKEEEGEEEEEEEGGEEEEDQKGMFLSWNQVYFGFLRFWFGDMLLHF